MIKNVVSILIPCYNAARWVAEAVDSCLTQTYQPIEVIVIDDGSTDDSLAVLRAFGEKIRVETGPNRGGNWARNRGFALSQGEYIQFLDADDYLLPEKIAHQVDFLEQTGADAVYGDWRHQFHEPDGRVWQDDIHVSGEQIDLLEVLLQGWWTPSNTLLFRRQAALAAGGWDEALQAAQDRDFLITVALVGAKIGYQPGCDAIYRRYGQVTVSTSNRSRWLESHRQVLGKAERRLETEGRLTAQYRRAMAKSYFHLARNYYDLDKQMQQRLYEKVRSLDPNFVPCESAMYNITYRLLGFRAAERLAALLRAARS